MALLTTHTIAELRRRIQRWRDVQQKIAFVPTMGNLHKGHIELVNRAHELADRVVVSIFVNPLQFGPDEDYPGYPRTLEADQVQLAVAGTDILFVPDAKAMYPTGTENVTKVEIAGLSEILDGAYRPGHFIGVATVVAKLLNIVRPDVALFGQKDYQQLAVIRRMVRDLCMPIEIVGMATVRETDGLALSSRNQYLSKSQRTVAPLLYRTLRELVALLRTGERDFARLEHEAVQKLTAGGMRPDYVCIRMAGSLAQPDVNTTRFVVLAAAWLGKARLIDNLEVDILTQTDQTQRLRPARAPE